MSDKLVRLAHIILAATLLAGASTSYASEKLITCKNSEDAVAYASFAIKTAKAFRIPAGSIATIDLLLRTTTGPPLISGTVRRGDKFLTAQDGRQRWFLILEDWICKYTSKTETKA